MRQCQAASKEIHLSNVEFKTKRSAPKQFDFCEDTDGLYYVAISGKAVCVFSKQPPRKNGCFYNVDDLKAPKVVRIVVEDIT